MKNDKLIKNRLPDAINCSPSFNYTQIRNDILRNNEISLKAKGLLALLMSNKKGWKSCKEELFKKTKEGREAIESGLKELEEHGYFIRMSYRDKKTKKVAGSFWAYTDIPNDFFMDNHLEILNDRGYELKPRKIMKKQSKNLDTGFPDTGFPDMGNPRLKRLSSKKTKSKKTNIVECEKRNSPIIKKQKPTPPQKDKKVYLRFLPQAKLLSQIIQAKKNIRHTPSQIDNWAKEIERLHIQNRITSDRIKSILYWYQNHIGEDYIPVVESGRSFREKFIRLEDAKARNGNRYTVQQSKLSNAVHAEPGKYDNVKTTVVYNTY